MNVVNRHPCSPAMCLAICLAIGNVVCGQQEKVSFSQVAPVFKQYCGGCHDGADPEGGFSVHSWTAVMAGTPDGPVLVSGDLQQSRLWQMISGQSEPIMPPADEPQPAAEELALLRAWIAQGAVGQADASSEAMLRLDAPDLPAAAPRFHHVGAACQVSDTSIAIGGLSEVRLLADGQSSPLWTASGLAGKVNSLRLSPAGNWLVVGGGIAGVGGEAVLLDPKQGTVFKRFLGHDDTIYCAATSPDGSLLATGSYDRRILLWDIESGQVVRELSGHNGAIYDLDFDPRGQLLVTASADQTLKVWRVDSGERLDTLGQPEGEQRAVRFSPDGNFIYAAGADKQIRKWQVVSREHPAINPMLVARYAHEGDIVQLAFADQQRLLSSSTDKTVKLWDAAQISSLGTVADLGDVPVGMCLLPGAAGTATVVQLDSARISLKLAAPKSPLPAKAAPELAAEGVATTTVESDVEGGHAAEVAQQPAIEPAAEPATEYSESEPNNSPEQALAITPAAVVKGTIAAPVAGQADQDLVRFHAQPNETWIIEVNAARAQSPLDSRIDILDAHGEPVVRTRLQATRASYLTFRGKDSTTSDDFRLHKWEDMELDEYLYTNGEVNRLWLYPRGPDSGFKVYPGAGSRYAFFDTTSLAHALGQTNYVVRELAADEQPLPNGLPVFPILYENDDDALARFGKDSRLTFVAPASGEYFLRIRDARGFGGEDYTYQLTLRQPQPDFQLTLSGTEIKLPVSSGREWSVAARRIDGLDGAISIELAGLPEGVLATNPLIIEAGQETALGCVYVPPAALEKLGDQKSFEVQLTATAQAAARTLSKPLSEKLVVTIEEAPEVQLRLVNATDPDVELEELSIAPGETVTALVVVERNGTESRIELGNESSGRNLPHGAFVDNIGLNGLLIPEGQTQREFFITAAPKVAPGRRQFHLRSGTPGNPTSRPIWLNVVAQP